MAFASLDVWQKPEIREQLSWYYNVSIDHYPAKFNIASRIPVTEGQRIDNQILQEFRDFQYNVINSEIALESIKVDENNLLDLVNRTLWEELAECKICAWNCGIDRYEVEKGGMSRAGICQLGTTSYVSTAFPHRGEELVFRGTRGSGTIFFTSCNMRCGFCQNGDISQDRFNGTAKSPAELAVIIHSLRELGCHNINFVGGDPVIHLQTISAALLELANQQVVSKHTYRGLFNAPMLWNSNFYISNRTLDMLQLIMDVWLPDLKFHKNKCARRLSKTSNYFSIVSNAISTLYEQNESIVIRHLVMPNHVECCSLPILDWIADKVPNVLVNIMGQYRPESFANPYSKNFKERLTDISRPVTSQEMLEVYHHASALGIRFENVSFQ